jgi:hypothetical protein
MRDGSKFDRLAKGMAGGMSRRDALKAGGTGIAGVVLATLMPGEAFATKLDPCKDFCNSLATAAQRAKCKLDAAQHAGVCYRCGPGNPNPHGPICNGVCCDTGQTCTDGVCTSAACDCAGSECGFRPDESTVECGIGPDGQTPCLCATTLDGVCTCFVPICLGIVCVTSADCPPGTACTGCCAGGCAPLCGGGFVSTELTAGAGAWGRA